jgi:uncharacterized protein YyaL (SSP411 family)
MPNRLAHETSPYLLQHKDNPVDWFPWGDEAFEKARRENKPVLVSIGYSSCHWCHVMAHESFENDDIANDLNQAFISIKVDREERPDIDAIYMSAVQGMLGHGGWPLNVFLTPDGLPFFGGTYWPPEDRGGMPGFRRVLRTLDTTWRTSPEKLLANADQMREFLQNSTASLPADQLSPTIAETAVESLRRQHDPVWGGFGNAPKFPQTPVLDFLLRHYSRSGDQSALDIAITTLDRIADGGIHDHLAGGFARYSVDAEWLVPHFEKMLYDNAQLMQLYVDAWKITGNERYRAVIRGIASWAIDEMLTPHGGFCAALDADSEGEEGKFYVWTAAEIDEHLPADEADLVRVHFGVTKSGNFEHGTNILHIARTLRDIAESSGQEFAELVQLRDRAVRRLLDARAQRVRPGRDDKIITSWNALMIKSLVLAADIIDDPRLLSTARTAARFLLDNVRAPDGHLRHTWKDGQTRGDGVLEDYAFLADAMIELYRATADVAWLEDADSLGKIVLEEFRHDSGIGFYDTGIHHETLVTRPRDLQDNATPSGNSVMADVLLTIGTYRQDEGLVSTSRAILEGVARPMAEYPTAFGRVLACLERHLAQVRELVFAGDPESDALHALRDAAAKHFIPAVVVGYATSGTDATWPMLMDRPQVGQGAAYLCQNHTCLPPVTDPAALAALLETEVIATG